MGEYFTFVNKTKKQYIDPIDFPEELTPELGIKHGAWMRQMHVIFPVYLLTESNHTHENSNKWRWYGEWASDEIALIGDTRSKYEEIHNSHDYDNISSEVYLDVLESYETITPNTELITPEQQGNNTCTE